MILEGDEAAASAQERAIKDLLRSLAVWKYASTTIVVIVLTASCVWLGKDSGFGLRDLALGLAGSALAAVALSLYYDIFMRRQQTLESKLQSHELLQNYTLNILGTSAASILSPDGSVKLLKSLLERPKFLNELASAAGAVGSDEIDAFTEYLHPLVERPKFAKTSVTNRLTLSKTDPDAYIWTCRERFVLEKPSEGFRVLVTDSNDTAIHLCRRQRVDCLILISVKTGGIDKWLQDHLLIEAHTATDGRGRPVEVSASAVPLSDVDARLHQARCRLLDVFLPTQTLRPVVTISFDQELSLKDPYFYWATDSFMYVEEVSIDYHDLISHALVNNVSVLSFCASSALRISHDVARGVVRADVGALMSAGEGIELIWRQQ